MDTKPAAHCPICGDTRWGDDPIDTVFPELCERCCERKYERVAEKLLKEQAA